MIEHKDTKARRRIAGFLGAFVPLCLCVLLIASPQRTSARVDAIRLNNLGVAYMNQARIAEALQTFRRAEMQDPSLFAARLNEGIALLNSQQVNEARDVLLDATRRQPQRARQRLMPSSKSPGSTRGTQIRCTFWASFTCRRSVTIRLSRLLRNASHW